jgi:hypothetical protein
MKHTGGHSAGVHVPPLYDLPWASIADDSYDIYIGRFLCLAYTIIFDGDDVIESRPNREP